MTFVTWWEKVRTDYPALIDALTADPRLLLWHPWGSGRREWLKHVAENAYHSGFHDALLAVQHDANSPEPRFDGARGLAEAYWRARELHGMTWDHCSPTERAAWEAVLTAGMATSRSSDEYLARMARGFAGQTRREARVRAEGDQA
jgi:hypothetical protein